MLPGRTASYPHETEGSITHTSHAAWQIHAHLRKVKKPNLHTYGVMRHFSSSVHQACDEQSSPHTWLPNITPMGGDEYPGCRFACYGLCGAKNFPQIADGLARRVARLAHGSHSHFFVSRRMAKYPYPLREAFLRRGIRIWS